MQLRLRLREQLRMLLLTKSEVDTWNRCTCPLTAIPWHLTNTPLLFLVHFLEYRSCEKNKQKTKNSPCVEFTPPAHIGRHLLTIKLIEPICTKWFKMELLRGILFSQLHCVALYITCPFLCLLPCLQNAVFCPKPPLSTNFLINLRRDGCHNCPNCQFCHTQPWICLKSQQHAILPNFHSILSKTWKIFYPIVVRHS